MASLRTHNKRRRKRSLPFIHIVFNRGAYMNLDCGEHGVIQVPLNGLEQPRAYRKYYGRKRFR